MHDQEIIHGNLKGVSCRTRSRCPARNLPNSKAKILIDNSGRAYLTGFGRFMVVSDQFTDSLSTVEGGTLRWMSPECLNPEGFGLKNGRPTKESDCYALGMTIYEVLSVQVPFAQYNRAILVLRDVLDDKRPSRPEGTQREWFTDELWEMLERCWRRQPSDRPSLSDILECLQGGGRSSWPPSYVDGDVETDVNTTTGDSGMRSLFYPMFVVVYPCNTVGPLITRGDNGLLNPPKTGNPKEEWAVEKLARSARKIFKAATSRLGGL